MATLKRAQRSQAKIKIAIGGTSGSGKTASSLLLAFGLVKAAHPELSDGQVWEKICVIDTENQSASLYANATIAGTKLGEYFTIDLEPPFEVDKYIDAIHSAEKAGIEVLIIDSMSHAWSGEGGALDKQSKIAARSGNSYTAWREPKADQQRLMDTVLQSSCHIISCIRAKTEYAQQKDDRGKTVVKKLGMGLITQGESQYEYTLLFMLDSDHVANAEKDRTGMFDGKYFTITPDTGAKLYAWLASGAEPKPEKPVAAPVPVKVSEEPKATAPSSGVDGMSVEMLQKTVTEMVSMKIEANPESRLAVISVVKGILGVANPMKCTDKDKLLEAFHEFEN